MVAAYFVYDVDSNLVWCYTVIYTIKRGGYWIEKEKMEGRGFYRLEKS